MENNQVEVIPEYEIIKRRLLGEFYLSKQNLTSYDFKPTIINENNLRESLIELARSLQFKTYILTESKIKEFFANFLSKPYEYKSFYNHTIRILDELLNLLDVDLFDAWKIFYNQESFAYIENWEELENVESIDDLNLKIKEYNPIKEALGKYEVTPLNNNLIN